MSLPLQPDAWNQSVRGGGGALQTFEPNSQHLTIRTFNNLHFTFLLNKYQNLYLLYLQGYLKILNIYKRN